MKYLALLSVLYIYTSNQYFLSMRERAKKRMQAMGIVNPRVLKAFSEVPREFFVPDRYKKLTYSDTPLPIGYGQTITDPYFVLLMTQKLDPQPNDVFLEIGTGSGYQASILSRIVKKVYTIEIVPQLAKQATERFKALNYTNIVNKQGDGYFGWKEYAPFDKIIVTCAIDHIPPYLLAQLKVGGMMCIPVGNPFKRQNLLLVKKISKTKIITENIANCRFVPFTGNH